MKEEIVWRPSDAYVKNANITRFMATHNIHSYEELLERAKNIEWFWDAIMKDLEIEWYVPYEKVYDTSEGIEWTKWYLGGKLNIVHNCIDKNIRKGLGNKIAVIWEGGMNETSYMTYEELYKRVNSLANALKKFGIKKGDTIGIYMPMIPELVVAFFAILKIGAICVPIFSGFGSKAVATRLNDAGAKILFTADGTLRKGKSIELKKEADAAVEEVPSIEKVIVVKRLGIEIPWNKERDVLYEGFSDEVCETEKLSSEDVALIIYSSGTTGRPKGTVHTHAGCLAQMCKEIGYYFDVKKDDIFFWLTDIGWMMGPWMIIGVLHFGGTILIFEGTPDYPKPDKLWEIIEKHKVTIFGISPTAVRMLMRYGEEWVMKHNLSSLRILGSTGEPWDVDSWLWYFQKVGGEKVPIINISGGTEIVGCFLSPLPITELKPCTLRGPGLGMVVDVFDDDGKPVKEKIGHLVALQPAPSMTKGFWKDTKRYIETYWSRWKNVWYHGDWASIDKDGFWYLHGRSDDTIKVAGRRVGPAEIEGVLIEHPAVSEAAVIGVPDEIKGEAIVAFVVLSPSWEPSEKLRAELEAHVVSKLGKTLKPDKIKFTKDLPKTRTAKIVRRVIKARYLDLPLGDISSIENQSAIEDIKNAI